MSSLSVACELGPGNGRVMLGALEKEGLTISEAGELHALTNAQKDDVIWDIPAIYQQVLAAAGSCGAGVRVI